MEDRLRLLLLILSFLGGWALALFFLAPTEEQALLASRLQKLGRGSRGSQEERGASPGSCLLSWRERAVLPLFRSLRRLATRWTPYRIRRRWEGRLDQAGRPFPFEFLLLLKLLGVPLVAIFLFSLPGGRKPLLLLVGGIAGYFLPDLAVGRLISRRQAAMRKAFPDTIDLLCLSVEAGLGFDAALQKVAEKIPGPLSEEFQIYLREVSLGSPRVQALERWATRVDLFEAKAFAAAVAQAEQLGTGLSRVLRVQSEDMRRRRRQRAEQQAMQAPVKLVFPLVLCIFPALLVVILGPAFLQILSVLFRP